MRTKPGRELDGRAEDIVRMFYRFPRGGADPDLQIVQIPARQFLLNLGCATDSGCRRNKSRHYSIAQMFDFVPVRGGQGSPHNGVVNLENFHRLFISQTLGERSRIGDVGEKNRCEDAK